MNRLLASLLFFCAPSFAAIAFVASSIQQCSGTSASSCQSGNVTVASGNTIFVVYSIKATTSTGNAPSLASNTFTQVPGCALNNSTTIRVECWSTTVNGSTTVTAQKLTCNLSANANFSCAMAAFSGAALIGTVQTATGSSSNPVSPTITTQDANDWCIGAFAGSANGASTALTGNLRDSAVCNNCAVAITDNTAASSGSSCTSSITNTDTVWALAAVELRTSSAPCLAASTTDSPLVGDSPSGLGTHFATKTDAVLLGSSSSGIGGHFGSPTDAVLLASSSSGLGAHFGAPTDAVLLASSSSGLGSHFGSISDAVLLASSSSGLGVHFGAPTDSSFLADSSSGRGSHFGAISDAVLLSSIGAAIAAHAGSVLDSLGISEASSSLRGRGALVSDSIAVSETASGRSNHMALASDSSGVMDSAARLMAKISQSVESLFVSSGASGRGSHSASTFEVLSASDIAVAGGLHIIAFVSELFTTKEVVAAAAAAWNPVVEANRAALYQKAFLAGLYASVLRAAQYIRAITTLEVSR